MRYSLAAVIAAAAVLAGCQVHAQEDKGPTISKNYQVGPFQKIAIAGPFDVEVRTGANPGVSAKGSQGLLDRTTVEVEGDQLSIKVKNQTGFHWNNGKASFVITLPQLSQTTFAGAGEVRIDKVSGPAFKGTVAGAGDMSIGNLAVQQLSISLAGAGNFKGAGSAQTADYDLAGAGKVDASGIQTQQLKVSIAGAGGVKAHASGTADISTVGAGDVEITGGAKCSSHKVGAGSIRCS